ncbi:biotin synthesis protein [Idiomarina xiamenensis 10-D-4]|uniref:Biotin synthesis protein n=2 Tax=Idiomarina xiamenensis TaxID=1207041 RepID=K2KJV3_9GAMM|nr:biotin synthesis protein [Idiomarina xiamenensis 10-D-4]
MTQMYDKELVARHFSRAANHYHQHDALQQYCATQLLAALPDQQPDQKPDQQPAQHSELVVDVGCGPASQYQQLARHGRRYIGVDIAAGMLHQAQQRYPTAEQPWRRWLQADAEQLPLADDSVELVVANLSLQWCNDMTSAVAECVRVLKPGATALIALVLDGSLVELRQAWQGIDQQPHQNRFVSAAKVEQLLQQLQRHYPQLRWQGQQQRYCQQFSQVRQLLMSIKGVGASYTAGRQSGLLTPRRLRELEQAWPQDAQQCYPLSWCLGFWKLTR